MITPGLIESALLDSIPRAAFSINQHDSANGLWTTIEPTNVNAAQLSVCLNRYGNCDVLFGRAFARELELSDSDLLLALAGAALKGRFTEAIWCIGKTTLYSKSVIQLDHANAVIRSGIPLPYPWWWKHSYRYEPYSVDR